MLPAAQRERWATGRAVELFPAWAHRAGVSSNKCRTGLLEKLTYTLRRGRDSTVAATRTTARTTARAAARTGNGGIAGRGLAVPELEHIRGAVTGARRPKVIFARAAGQIAGQQGQVVELTDPRASDEWVVVRFG